LNQLEKKHNDPECQFEGENRGVQVHIYFTEIAQKKIKHGVNEHRRVLQGAVDFHHWSDGFHGKSASGEATEMLSWN
jgi:hypothetical protein